MLRSSSWAGAGGGRLVGWVWSGGEGHCPRWAVSAWAKYASAAVPFCCWVVGVFSYFLINSRVCGNYFFFPFELCPRGIFQERKYQIQSCSLGRKALYSFCHMMPLLSTHMEPIYITSGKALVTLSLDAAKCLSIYIYFCEFNRYVTAFSSYFNFYFCSFQ